MRAANRPLGKAAARRAMCAFLAITPFYGLVLDARLVRKILPVAGPAAAVIGSLVAVGEPANIFETAHVVVIVEPARPAGTRSCRRSGSSGRRTCGRPDDSGPCARASRRRPTIRRGCGNGCLRR